MITISMPKLDVSIYQAHVYLYSMQTLPPKLYVEHFFHIILGGQLAYKNSYANTYIFSFMRVIVSYTLIA